ncbi:MAG: ATP-binding protein [Marinobacter sp.]
MRIKVVPEDGFGDIVDRLTGGLGNSLVENERYADYLVVLDEFYANLKSYVAPKADRFFWMVDTDIAPGEIRVKVEYPGACFDPTQAGMISEQSIETRPIGGLGLAIISALSDTMTYHYEKGWNVIRLQLNCVQNTEDKD